MGLLTHDDFVVLNGLYLRKIAEALMLAECAGLDLQTVEAALSRMAADGLVLALGEQYVVTDEGRQAVLDFYAETYTDLRADGEVMAWYERFEVVNGKFLQQVSAHQISGDDKGLGKLIKLVEKHISALEEAAKWLPRYSQYADRFSRALSKVEAGKMEYLTSPTVDSVHNAWFEFHEDILAVIGRPRETVDG
jgi:hypothetical protein